MHTWTSRVFTTYVHRYFETKSFVSKMEKAILCFHWQLTWNEKAGENRAKLFNQSTYLNFGWYLWFQCTTYSDVEILTSTLQHMLCYVLLRFIIPWVKRKDSLIWHIERVILKFLMKVLTKTREVIKDFA